MLHTLFVIVFIFSMGINILNLISIICGCCHNNLTLPSLLLIFQSDITPKSVYIFYPCFFFQVYYWTFKLGILI